MTLTTLQTYSLPISRRQALDDFERDYWRKLCEKHGGKVTAVAKEARVNRRYVYARLHLLRLKILQPSRYGRRIDWDKALSR